jgi:metallo-beta-lactamase family protein
LPLYTHADALRSLEYLVPVEYGTRVELPGNVQLRLRPAGHLLGASLVEFRAAGKNVLFSGDLGRPNDPLNVAPAAVDQADYLLVESTYGDRRHDATDPREQLASVINRTAARGGAVLVPAFAVGRAQSVLHLIGLLKAAGAIPDLPVFLNSPMAIHATALFKRHRREHRLTPAQCDALQTTATMVRSVEESKRLNELRGPMIIISASGMATGGRVIHHLKSLAPDARNTILFAGYQAAGTRGAALVNGATTIKIHGEQVPVGAEVVTMNNLSAHADYAEILDWLGGFRAPPKRTFVVHGEPGPADALRRRIEERLRWQVAVPEYRETVELS